MSDSTTLPLARTLREIRIRASLLMKAARTGDPVARARLGASPKRRRVLDIVAHEMTATGYRALLAKAKSSSGTVSGAGLRADPALIFDRYVAVFCSHWFARVEDARAHLSAQGGTLLPYRTQYVVVEPELLAAVGLDPHDMDWDRIGHDWTDPRDLAAFDRLNKMLVSAGFSAEANHAD